MLQWFRFAYAAEGVALCFADELVDPFHHALVLFLQRGSLPMPRLRTPALLGQLPLNTFACVQLRNG